MGQLLILSDKSMLFSLFMSCSGMKYFWFITIQDNTSADIVNKISVHTAQAKCIDIHTQQAKMHVRVSARATVCILTDAPRMTNTCEAPVPSYRKPSLSSDSASNFSRSAILVCFPNTGSDPWCLLIRKGGVSLFPISSSFCLYSLYIVAHAFLLVGDGKRALLIHVVKNMTSKN